MSFHSYPFLFYILYVISCFVLVSTAASSTSYKEEGVDKQVLFALDPYTGSTPNFTDISSSMPPNPVITMLFNPLYSMMFILHPAYNPITLAETQIEFIDLLSESKTMGQIIHSMPLNDLTYIVSSSDNKLLYGWADNTIGFNITLCRGDLQKSKNIPSLQSDFSFQCATTVLFQLNNVLINPQNVDTFQITKPLVSLWLTPNNIYLDHIFYYALNYTSDNNGTVSTQSCYIYYSILPDNSTLFPSTYILSSFIQFPCNEPGFIPFTYSLLYVDFPYIYVQLTYYMIHQVNSITGELIGLELSTDAIDQGSLVGFITGPSYLSNKPPFFYWYSIPQSGSRMETIYSMTVEDLQEVFKLVNTGSTFQNLAPQFSTVIIPQLDTQSQISGSWQLSLNPNNNNLYSLMCSSIELCNTFDGGFYLLYGVNFTHSSIRNG